MNLETAQQMIRFTFASMCNHFGLDQTIRLQESLSYDAVADDFLLTELENFVAAKLDAKSGAVGSSSKEEHRRLRMQSKSNDWISIKEKQPEIQGEEVEVWHSETASRSIGFYGGEGYWDSECEQLERDHGRTAGPITHWRQIQEPLFPVDKESE